MEYEILEGHTIESLRQSVRIALLSDWVPVGGLTVSIDNESRKMFYQAMVKYRTNGQQPSDRQ